MNTPIENIQNAAKEIVDNWIGTLESIGLVMDDPVDHPAHYTKGGIECLDAIRASMSDPGFLDFLKGQVVKYIWRYQHKGKPLEDLRKAEFYLHCMIEMI